MALTELHRRFPESIRWRLTADGLEIEGNGIERTPGKPTTVTRIWEHHAEAINRSANLHHLPCALIVATICTESGGDASAIRTEPGYVSDHATPDCISAGLMQTLISTAREVMGGNSIDRAWLLDPAHSIEAGTAFIAAQFDRTAFDPPLVAAAYNAGGIYEQTGSANRWKLRQYPIGTGQHCDRFIRFFNDAVAVLGTHATRPAVGIEELLGSTPPLPRPPSGEQIENGITVAFGPGARASDVTPYSRAVLEDILRICGLRYALISSTQRSPTEQARIMYDNLEKLGVAAQKRLYAAPGDQVIDVYVAAKGARKTGDQIKAEMERKIREIGPTRVSRHASDPNVLNVFDVAPSSIANRRAFELAIRADSRVRKFLAPPADPGYHLEIPQPH